MACVPGRSKPIHGWAIFWEYDEEPREDVTVEISRLPGILCWQGKGNGVHAGNERGGG
ncbi:MAG: hypothetical protein ACFCU4_05255 [Puniceicoccaceae bacterium]